MFDKVLNAPLVFYRIAIFRISFTEGLFVLKLQAVCLQCYCENSATDNFSGNFPNFSEQLLFKTLGDCFIFHQKLLIYLCFPCSISFKTMFVLKTICRPFCPRFFTFFDLMILKLQNFDFWIMLSHEINFKNMWNNF